MAEAGQVWTGDEIDAIVADYLAMLALEQSGKSFVKAERRRLLQQKIDRSAGSIERKHQNISAVLELIGLPYINGYKPLRNYQKKLLEKVQSELQPGSGRSSLYDLLTGREDTGGIELTPLEFDDGPPVPTDARRLPDDIQRLVRNFGDPAERDARNRRLGKQGEMAVFASEKDRLIGLGREDLAKEVRWVARDEGDGHGFDIVSFAGQGGRADQETWLEVKTTTGAGGTPFFITRNELRVADENPEKYRIVRLYNFNTKRRAFELQPPLCESVDLVPSVYQAKLWPAGSSV